MGLITLQYPVPNIAQVSLTAGLANSISPAVLNELPLLITSSKSTCGFFWTPRERPCFRVACIAYQLPLRAADFKRFYGTHDSLDRIIRLPCPSVTALNGHAVAAGFILSLATD